MRTALALSVLASFVLLACGGENQEAKSADDAAWSDFKGTYSQPAEPRTVSEKSDQDVAKNPAVVNAKAAPVEPTEAPIAPAPAAPKSSKATIKGESLSTITVDALTDASTALTKSKLVSNGVITGSNYEVVSVQTKKATIKITRPSADGAKGPELAAPKSKVADLAASDAYWYDSDADVLVVVTGVKKAAAAQKTLNAMVKH